MAVHDGSLRALAERLSAASVTRRWEAYRDVDWDHPSMSIDPVDPRFELPSWDPLGATSWYARQTAGTRSRLGLFRLVTLLKVGIEFEAVLQRGLLSYASSLPDGDPRFRYIYHEISEEAQHTLMFQEFVKRSEMSIAGASDRVQLLYTNFADGRWDVFFLAALTAEHVFDQLQRRLLNAARLHPLFRRICEIHIAEEARHIAFARRFLHDVVPRQTDEELRMLRMRAPFVVSWVGQHVLLPPTLVDGLAEQWEVPTSVAHSLSQSVPAKALARDCTGAIVRLCRTLDLVDPRLSARWSMLEFPTELHEAT